MKTSCENCNKSPQPNSLRAFVCIYYFTFCLDFVKNILKKNVQIVLGILSNEHQLFLNLKKISNINKKTNK